MNEPCLSPLPGSPGSNEELAAKPGDSLLLYLGHIHDGISQLYWLLYLACSRPSEVFGRHYLNVLVIPGPLPSTWDILLQTGEDVCAEGLAFLIKAAGHFITAPWYSPEDHARRLYTERARTRDVDKQREATRLHAPKGAVRVKWYPDLEAPLKPWSEGLAELWTDLPIQADGSIDLRPLKRMWGMENIYVIDANHGRRMRIGRRPDEVLSGLAWTVLLGRHDVLGVVEVVSPAMRAARRARAFVVRACTEPALWLEVLELAGWTAVTLSALTVFAFWHVSSAALGLVPLAVLCAWRICVTLVLASYRACVAFALKAARWQQRVARRRTVLTWTRALDREDADSDSCTVAVQPRPVLQPCGATLSYLGSVLLPWLIFAAVAFATLLGSVLLDLSAALFRLWQDEGDADDDETRGSGQEDDDGEGEYDDPDEVKDDSDSGGDVGEFVPGSEEEDGM